MKATTVDEFISQKVQPQHREIVTALRQAMKKHAPEAKEVLTYGILGWRRNKMLAVVSPTKKDVTFAFAHGADFEDKYKLLRGVGRVSKHLKFASMKDVNPTALSYYIKQALKFDAAKK